MEDRNKSPLLKSISRGIGVFAFLLQLQALILAIIKFERLTVFIEADFGFVLLSFSINALITTTLALLIISSNPRQVIGWLFLASGFMFSWFIPSFLTLGLYNNEAIPEILRPFFAIGGMLYLLPLMVILSLVPLFYPDGRLPSRRWWPVLAITIFGTLGQIISQIYLDFVGEMPE